MKNRNNPDFKLQEPMKFQELDLEEVELLERQVQAIRLLHEEIGEDTGSKTSSPAVEPMAEKI
jgi:hypothetical protein